MKHKLLFALLLVVSVAAKAAHHNIDSTYHPYLDTATNTWIDNGKYIGVWDEQCHHQLQFLGFYWNTGTMHWDSSYRYNYSYDGQGRYTAETYDASASGGLRPYYNYIYTYAGQNLSNYIVQDWVNWMNDYRNAYKYDYHYIASSSLYDTVIAYSWDTAGSAWQLSGRYIYMYDAAGNDTFYLRQNYNSGTMSFTDVTQYHYVFTAANKVQNYFYENWSGAAWLPVEKYIYNYDGNNNNTDYYGQAWSSDSSAWRNDYKVIYSLNANGDADSGLVYDWNTVSSSYFVSSKYLYYYGCEKYTGIETVADDMVQLYPNPASVQLQLVLEQLNKPSTLSVINLQGEVVMQQTVASGSNNIDVSQLANGMYLLQWQSGGKLTTRKFVKD